MNAKSRSGGNERKAFLLETQAYYYEKILLPQISGVKMYKVLSIQVVRHDVK